MSIPPRRLLLLLATVSVASGHARLEAQQPPPQKPAATWEGHRASVQAITVAPGGKQVATASEDGTLRIWDVATGTCLAVCRDDGRVWTAAFLPQGTRLISGGADGRLSLWNTVDGTRVATFGLAPDSGRAIASLAVSADGRTAVTGGFDARVVLWDLDAKSVAAEWRDHADTVFTVAFGPGPDRVASGSFDGSLRIMHRTTHALETVLRDEDPEQRGWKRAMVVGREERTLLVAGAATPHEWDPVQRTSVAFTGTPHAAGSVSIATSTDGSIAASGGFDGHIHLWDTVARECIARWDAEQGAGVWAIAFLPDGRLLSAGNSGTVKVWDVPRTSPR